MARSFGNTMVSVLTSESVVVATTCGCLKREFYSYGKRIDVFASVKLVHAIY